MLVIIPNQGSQPCIKHHPAATPMDSVLYPLRRFPVSFATDTGTFGYSQRRDIGGVYRGRTDVICLEGRGINRYTNTPQDCG